MNYKMMGRFTAQLLFIEGIFLIPPLIISLTLQETAAVHGFLVTLAIIAALASVLFMLCKDARNAFYATDGMVCVAFSWLVLSLVGALPFRISGAIPQYVDALFETVSGFTTTGASVLTAVEPMEKGLLFWRSFTHWVGGMGVLVFLLAIAPAKGSGKGFTMHLLRAESPGPSVGKLVPKMRKTAGILYLLYVGLTVMDIILLLAGGMSVFEAFCTAFGTAGTGGFGVRNDSIASYSPYIQNVTAVFMLLFGVNFSCYYMLLLRQFRSVFKDEELRLYIGIVVGSIALIVWNLWGFYPTAEETLRHAAFQVSSIMTTTGFATTDFDLWPSFSKTILLCLMVIGASAGSTGGGIKVARVLLLFKSLKRNIAQMLHPRKIKAVRSNGAVVDERIIANTNAYLSAYVVIVFVSFIITSLDGFSTGTNFSAVLACLNNIGPGLELVGPVCNYSSFSVLSKLVLTLDMLLGRLEIFPILVLFSFQTWKNG
ncbi:MAG: TrkH family potassium uptake protein [Faecousia sp.]